MMLFPVKLGPWSAILLAAVLTACGYRAAYGGGGPRFRLSVAGTALATPHPEAVQAALSGARAELARSGALSAGNGYPKLFVEVVRVDEVATGIAATSSARGVVPLGRASAIGVSGHAWIVEREGAEPSSDTGDVRRVETVAQGDSPIGGDAAVDQAATSAARALGEALARRALGIAEPSVAPM
jgi:hypothetical protein